MRQTCILHMLFTRSNYTLFVYLNPVFGRVVSRLRVAGRPELPFHPSQKGATPLDSSHYVVMETVTKALRSKFIQAYRTHEKWLLTVTSSTRMKRVV